jgi:hypothetical protein
VVAYFVRNRYTRKEAKKQIGHYNSGMMQGLLEDEGDDDVLLGDEGDDVLEGVHSYGINS